MQFFPCGILPHLAQGIGLCLAPAFCERLGKVCKEYREPEPDGNGADESCRCLPVPEECLDPEQGGKDTADLDGKHHHVVVQCPRVEFNERIDNCTPVERVLVRCRDFWAGMFRHG